MCILHVPNLDAPLKKQKSWANNNAALRNTYIKEDDEDSQEPSDSCKCACTHACKHTHTYMHDTYIQ